jgi:putative tricarboxylic transport membrane protein
MLEAAASALFAFTDPYRMSMLLVGLLAGGIIGMMPGLGGIGAVSILLPFALTLDPFSGLAVLLGATGVVYTSDTIAAILFGTPTSASSGPTAIEGFAMAQRGEAGRALGGAFLASMIGGLIGAIVLTLSIPIAGPLVLALGTGELLMLAIKGILSAALGLFLGTVGVAPSAPELRFTFGAPYLLDGFALTILALGLFGVAEVIVMLGQGGAIAQQQFKLSGWTQGVRDVVRHWKVVASGSVIGVIFGVIPAVGASASTWIAYGQAVSTTKDKSMVGKGDPRGMLSAEGANNATITTDLVPTLLFAVPGGPAAAVVLGALFVYGYYPGPRFVQMNLDLMFLIVWSSALSAVLGAALCFAASPWIARITRVDFALVAAPLIAVILLGSFEAKKNVLDFATLFGFGALGWLMKRAQWPRAPLLVGFVLTDPIERNFWLAYQLHGWNWLKSPIVVGLIVIVGIHVALTLRRAAASRSAAQSTPARTVSLAAGDPRIDLGLLLALGAAALFAGGIAMSLKLAFDSLLVPMLAAIPGLIAAVALIAMRLHGSVAAAPWPKDTEVKQIGLLGAALATIPFAGFFPALGAYLVAMLWSRSNLRLLIVPYAAAILLAAYGLSKGFRIPLP